MVIFLYFTVLVFVEKPGSYHLSQGSQRGGPPLETCKVFVWPAQSFLHV